MRAKEYFKNETHYINYCMSIINNKNIISELATKENFALIAKTLFIETNKRTPAEYVSSTLCFENKLPDTFGEIIDFLKNGREVIIPSEILTTRTKSQPNRIFSEDFISLINLIEGRTGVYFIYNDENILIYVGRSRNLGDRTQTSSLEKNGEYIKVLILDNEADTNILEQYYITTLKPLLNNKHDKTTYTPSFEIKHEGTFTDTIKIFK